MILCAIIKTAKRLVRPSYCAPIEVRTGGNF